MLAEAPPIDVPSPSQHPYVLALNKAPPRGRVSPMYIVMLLAVTVMMLLLPAIYFSLIALVGYGIIWHITNDTGIFRELSPRAALVVYCVPIVVGGVLIAFMFKPLFAPRRQRYSPQAIGRKDEPIIYALVERLCDILGAPRPANIYIDMEMNASASFASVVTGKMQLTLGLPLIAGLSLNEFTGVLAHEFGHFAQRNAMRLSYLIRSINNWFARLVYERDSWDATLDEYVSDGGHWGVQLIALVARGCVWLTRRILWCLMMLGHLFSSLLLRQMEYDADGYSARTVGSKVTAQTDRALAVLNVSMQASFSDLGDALAEKRLPDNVPALVANRVQSFPPDIREKIDARMREEKTGWFSTHPASIQRIRAVERLGEPGIFDIDAPATAVFINFTTLCQIMTKVYYNECLGQRTAEINIVPVTAIEENRREQSQQAESLGTYLGGLPSPLRPVFVPDVSAFGDASARAEALVSVRASFARAVPDGRAAVADWEAADSKLAMVDRYMGIVNAGVPAPDPTPYNLPSRDSRAIWEYRRTLDSAREDARQRVSAALYPGMQRLALALSLDPPPAAPQARQVEEYELAAAPEMSPRAQQLAALDALQPAMATLDELRRMFLQQAAALGFIDTYGRNEHYCSAVISLSRKQCTAMEGLRTRLGDTHYPFSQPDKPMTLGSYLVMPTLENEVGKTMQAVEQAINRTYGLYMRLLATLADQAMHIEDELGLPPLVLPAAGAE